MIKDDISAFFLKVRKMFLNGNFIKFCLFGIINTFNTSLFSSLLSLLPFVQDNIAGILGYLISLQGAYLLTSKFIFRSKPNLLKYKRFLISYLPSFIVYILIHAGALGALNLPQFWASFIAVMLSGPLTFFIVKIYAFNESSHRRGKNYESEQP